MTNNRFYAYQENREDNGWDYGTYDKAEAMQWLADQAAEGNDEALVAVIEEGEDPICIREITTEDL